MLIPVRFESRFVLDTVWLTVADSELTDAFSGEPGTFCCWPCVGELLPVFRPTVVRLPTDPGTCRVNWFGFLARLKRLQSRI